MISGIDNVNNKSKIAIVAVGYNRKNSLARLLESLDDAIYNTDDVPLVISIDASGNQELYEYVKNFSWKHGEKYLNIQEKRLGLKNHIYQCGDLTKYFKAIALLEDDLWVSPYYYQYLLSAVEHYGEDSRICEISLYRNERLGRHGFYFDTFHDGSDCFLWQDVSTWGECWTEQMWNGFRKWLETHDDNYIKAMDIPEGIKKWERAWSKYFIAYEVDTQKYVLFPHESLTTNFNDAGGEHGGGSTIVQVNTLHGERHYRFLDTNDMVRYDIFTNNEALYKWLPEEYNGQVCLDIYGERQQYNGCRYVLSIKSLPYKSVEHWGLELRPLELNVLYKVNGSGITLYDTKEKASSIGIFNKEVVPYMLRGINPRLLVKYVLSYYWQGLSRKMRRFFKQK